MHVQMRSDYVVPKKRADVGSVITKELIVHE